MKILYFILGFIKGIASGGGGGATVDPVHTVTFMSEDGTEVLYQRSVVDGDDCADVVKRGLLATPTKESTPQYSYTHSGWSMTSGGAASSSALSAVTEDRTVYAAFTSAVRYYTITYLDEDGSVLKTESLAYGTMPTYIPEKDGYLFSYWEPELSMVTGDATYTAQFIETKPLNQYTWSEISEISTAGTGENYFALGDCKAVDLKGTVGTLVLDATYYVYIIGFNHNSEYEGSGIHFGTFKTAQLNGKDICLCDGNYGNGVADGTHYFGINHYAPYNMGGWKGCDIRYDVLGSTDTEPTYYKNTAAQTNKIGFDASTTCATDPVANTLMAALPSDLRAVMKPMTKYTDGRGNSSNVSANVSASVDYLPLLAEFEVYGVQKNANQYEQNKQKQYAYYAEGKSKIKYKHDSQDTAVIYWLRSPYKGTNNYFCYAKADGAVSYFYVQSSYGLAPIFKV